jgi:acyl carrier protein
MEEVPIGVSGELYVGGHGLARGYLGRAALTSERFVPSPFGEAEGERLYRTGDLARWLPDGNVEFLGRVDDQVKVRGYRIEPKEIESVLAHHQAVRQAVVLAREDVPGQRRLVGYIVADPGWLETKRGATEDDPSRAPESTPGGGEERKAGGSPGLVPELRAWLRARLPEFMVPSALILLPELPLTAQGKVDRRSLPVPSGERPELAGDFVAPRTDLERELARIWSEVLGVERVGAEDNFFELGGHSLLATQLVSRVRSDHGVELPLRTMFEAPTIAGLARQIQREKRRDVASIRPTERKGDLPLSFAQQRLWFLDQLVPGNPFYNIPIAVEIEGRLAVIPLKRSLTEIVRRHEALRTTFSARNGRAVQEIWPPSVMPVPVVDLSGLGHSSREVEARRLAEHEADRPFELSRGPLIRALLVRRAEAEHQLSLTVHHIVADGWSMGVLVRETAALYEAFRSGEPPPLAELPIQYADFTQWQRQWLQGEVLDQHLGYWRKQLAQLPALRLPTDRARPAVQSYRGGTRAFSLSHELSRAVRELTASEGVTPFMTLLAAFQALLFRYTAQDDIAVGSGIANRNRVEIEGMVGFFVNMLVLRTDLSGDPSFRDLLGRVREVCLSAYAHQDLPFEKLVDELAPERNLSHEPLFQVVFEVQNFPVRASSHPDGLRLRPTELEGRSAKYDLSLYFWGETEPLSGYFEYSTDLFEAATIERMLSHYQSLLQVVTSDPDERLSELPIMSEWERRRLLNWGSKQGQPDAATGYPPPDGETDVAPELESDVEEGVL